MSLDWETLKSLSGLSDTFLMYVDDEGTEIAIGSDREFQEALRLAKLNKNHMKFIVYDNQVDTASKMNHFGSQQPVIKPSEKFLEEFRKNKAGESANSNSKEYSCCCKGEAPEWFLLYMKKFEKELVYELKSHINDVIHSALDKEKKLSGSKSETKSDVCELFSEKTEIPFSPVCIQSKKKKKCEKDSTDLTEHREMKLPKRLEKLHATKSERLEKLDNKTRVLLEEKRRLLERKRHFKSKLEKNSSVTTEKKNFLKKSVFFRQNDVCLNLPPGSKFAVTLNVVNDGKVRWTAPRLQCYEFRGLSLKEETITLPRLLPNECCYATLKGQVSQWSGLNYVKCKVVDGSELLGPEFTCWAKVELSETPKSDLAVPKDTDDDATQLRDSEGTLIDFEKDIISSSQKKVEENITEIERRLHDIDLLRTSTYMDTNLKSKNFGKKSNKMSEELETGCDLILNFEEKETSWKERLARENLLFGSEASSCSLEKQKIINEKENIKNSDEGELESSSDSDMSLVFMLEEEDNFIMVPSKSPSPAESANEEKNFPNDEVKDKITESNEQLGTAANKRPPIKQDIKQEEPERALEKDEVIFNETFHPNQSSPTRSRRSPFGEEISKPKKMKSKSSEYRFTTPNLTQTQQPPLNFTQILEDFFENKPPKFTFTGEKEKKESQKQETDSEGRPPRFTFTGEKAGSSKEDSKKIPKTDAVGRVIYAVDSRGFCLPVENLLKKGERASPEGESSRSTEREQRRVNDVPAVNILPNALVNGASNVASIAFNTAKSVISNLQSAFVTEGKTEFGEPAYEDKVCMKAMFKLHDMGFTDLQVNRKLLLVHNNDVTKVIEELLRLHENSSDERQ